MYRRTQLIVGVLAVTTSILVPGLARAQGSSEGQTAPEGDAAAPVAPAQTNSTTAADSTATTSTTTTTTTTATAKKVWTNEDMGDVHNHTVLPTFSGNSSKPGNGKPAGSVKGAKDAKQYQDQILKLQSKLPPIDEQISELQEALNGNTVNSTRHYSGAKIDDWHEELAHLQKQRGDIATKISALQDEARRDGVPPNQIPE
ncbi:MAG TPA: hypothetical protein VIH88_13650 [Candidatus Acidoferrales bacterium]